MHPRIMPNRSADYSFLLVINPLTYSVFSLSGHNSRTTCRELRGNQGERGRKSCQWEILVYSIEPGNVTLAYCNMAAFNMSTEGELLTG